MRLLFYAPPFNTSARGLYKNLGKLEGIHYSECIGSMNGLIRHLRTPLGISTIGVIWPANKGELSRLLALRCLFRDMRIVLVLPDHEPQTISDGHLLRPRFICHADGEMTDVEAVMAKMTRVRQIPALQIAT
jgi:hypothetical protein